MEITYQLNQIDTVVKQLIDSFKFKVVILDAPMGAGKTTLTKVIAQQLGAKNNTNSPTFNLVNSYPLKNNREVFHFDLYRLESEDEAFDLGFEEYIDSGNWCFIEWADVITRLLPLEYHTLSIRIINENTRTLILK